MKKIALILTLFIIIPALFSCLSADNRTPAAEKTGAVSYEPPFGADGNDTKQRSDVLNARKEKFDRLFADVNVWNERFITEHYSDPDFIMLYIGLGNQIAEDYYNVKEHYLSRRTIDQLETLKCECGIIKILPVDYEFYHVKNSDSVFEKKNSVLKAEVVEIVKCYNGLTVNVGESISVDQRIYLSANREYKEDFYKEHGAADTIPDKAEYRYDIDKLLEYGLQGVEEYDTLLTIGKPVYAFIKKSGDGYKLPAFCSEDGEPILYGDYRKGETDSDDMKFIQSDKLADMLVYYNTGSFPNQPGADDPETVKLTQYYDLYYVLKKNAAGANEIEYGNTPYDKDAGPYEELDKENKDAMILRLQYPGVKLYSEYEFYLNIDGSSEIDSKPKYGNTVLRVYSSDMIKKFSGCTADENSELCIVQNISVIPSDEYMRYLTGLYGEDGVLTEGKYKLELSDILEYGVKEIITGGDPLLDITSPDYRILAVKYGEDDGVYYSYAYSKASSSGNDIPALPGIYGEKLAGGAGDITANNSAYLAGVIGYYR